MPDLQRIQPERPDAGSSRRVARGNRGKGFGNCHGCCADWLRGKRLAVANEFAEFIDPVYFATGLGNARKRGMLSLANTLGHLDWPILKFYASRPASAGVGQTFLERAKCLLSAGALFKHIDFLLVFCDLFMKFFLLCHGQKRRVQQFVFQILNRFDQFFDSVEFIGKHDVGCRQASEFG